MIGMGILQPAIVLMAWTMVIWALMYATRIPAMSRHPDIDAASKVGGTGKDLDGVLPDKIQWVAHNYNHLHEAPTVFYAVAIILAILGQGDGINAMIGWIYVGVRIIHSLVQVTANRVMVRFALFLVSSIALIALILHAAMTVF